MKITLITGPASSVQGWGDDQTTRRLATQLTRLGHPTNILFVTQLSELLAGLKQHPCDLAWTSLYHMSSSTDFVGDGEGVPWVLDVLDGLGIPYVGSGADSMRAMLDKKESNRRLRQAGVSVPRQWSCGKNQAPPETPFPVLVKPRFESESNGINETSVVTTRAGLTRQVTQIQERFRQGVVIEEYLPGREFTVSMMNNGLTRGFRPIEVFIDRQAYQQHALLTGNMKTDGFVRFDIPTDRAEALCELADATAWALECRDHVRIDIREDAAGQLQVIDVNGIPGLNPSKSRTLVIEQIYGTPPQLALLTLISELLASVKPRLRQQPLAVA